MLMGVSFPDFCRRFCFISRIGLHLFLNRTVVAYVFIDSRLFILTLLGYPSPATSTATSRTIAVAIAFASAFLEEAIVDGISGHEKEEQEQYDALCVHRIRVIVNAANHAMTHWKTRIIIAQVLPSSRRIVAMAAMHGV